MSEDKKKSFVGGAALLAVAGLLTKVIGFFFRIPIANIIGDQGMGYYQTAFPIYAGMLSISVTGIPTAISKLVAERSISGHHKDAYKVYKCSMKLMTLIGLVTGLGLFIFAPMICDMILEPNAVWCMYAMAPALVVCPILSAVRGYFLGKRNVTPTAVSQVIEQVFRVVGGVAFTMLFLNTGLEYAAGGASLGAFIGGILALITVFLFLRANKKKIKRDIELETEDFTTSSKEIYKQILVIAVPITIGGLIMPIINTIDTIIIKQRLVGIGFSPDVARGLYGQFTGLAQPIADIPDAITAAVVTSLIPTIVEAVVRKDQKFLNDNIELSVRYGTLIGIPCAIGMMTLAKPIMLFLYPNQIEAATSAVSSLVFCAPCVVFFALNQVFAAILQGMGKQIIPVKHLLVAAIVKAIFTYLLCGIKEINILGAAIASVLTYMVAALLNYISVKKYTNCKIRIGLSLFRPLVASIGMGFVSFYSYKLFSLKFGNTVSLFVAIVLAVIAYIILIFVTGSITVDEIKKIKIFEKLLNKLDKILKRDKNRIGR